MTASRMIQVLGGGKYYKNQREILQEIGHVKIKIEMISKNFLLLTLYTSHIFVVIFFSNVITFGFCRKWARWYLSLTWYGWNNYKRDSYQDIMIQCTPEILKLTILFYENNSLFEASFLWEEYFIKTLVPSSYWTYFQYLWNLCGWGKVGLSYNDLMALLLLG